MVDLDLDALVGSITVRRGGRDYELYAEFVSADEARYERLQERLTANQQRILAGTAALERHRRAVQEAKDRNEPVPEEPPDGQQYGESHPDFYSNDAYDRDVFALLTGVWQASERFKPQAQREEITEEIVRGRLGLPAARMLLDRLWLSRFVRRAPEPAAQAQPAAEEKEAVTRTKRRPSAARS